MARGPALGYWLLPPEPVELPVLEDFPVHEDRPAADEIPGGGGAGVVVAAFVIGLLTGAAGLFAAVWLTVP